MQRLTAYQMALAYYDMVFKDQQMVERYLGAVFPALTVDSFAMKSLSVLRGWVGEPVGVGAGPWMVDIVRNMVAPSFYSGSTRDARLALDLIEMDSSVFEHRVMPPVVNEEGVSAVKIMHASAAQGWEIFLVNSANWEETRFLYLHQHEESFLDAIEDLVNEGARVYVPRYPITIGGWRGSGYIGGGQYIISGGTGASSPVTQSGGSGSGNQGRPTGNAPCTCPSCCENAGASKVNLSNGNLNFDETETFIAARGIPVQFTRAYNSVINRDVGLGVGWAWTYGIRIFEAADGVVTVFRENGAEDVFVPGGTSDYDNPPGVYDVLVKHAGGFTLTDREGKRKEFDTGGKLLSIHDLNGNTVTVQYSDGFPSTVTDAGGRVVLSFTVQNGHITGVTDLYGRSLGFEYAGGDMIGATDLLWRTERYVYDAGHRIVEKTDKNGNSASIFYDANGRWSRTVDREGFVRSAEYDYLTHRTKYTDANGNTSQYGYDSNGAKTQYVDGEGNLVEYTRDANVNITAVTDARGSRSLMEWDQRGNLTAEVDALGNRTEHTYDPVLNRRTSTTDAEGKVRAWTFDAAGNVTSEIDPDGNTTIYVNDSFGQVTEIRKPGGQTETMVYDNTSGALLSTADTFGNQTVLSHDQWGNVISFTDPSGKTRSYAKDASGRIVSVALSGRIIQTLEYEPNGNLAFETDANGNRTERRYDKNGRQTQEIDAQGNVTTRVLDGNGNIVEGLDAKGNRTQLVFNKN
ncbi:MAG: RHS repeat protein, partial [Ignavibacteriae bacterium]|nr:RHS repeat protein [Ignavibacteriota bacterium]